MRRAVVLNDTPLRWHIAVLTYPGFNFGLFETSDIVSEVDGDLWPLLSIGKSLVDPCNCVLLTGNIAEGL